MEASPWQRRAASRCWITSPLCPILANTAAVLYPLPEILLLVFAATIAGADDFVETTLWGTDPPGPSWRYPMTKVEVLDPGRDRANGYKVDVTCGERIGRHSTRGRLHSMRR
jgi:hypothetical protein